MKTSEQAPMTPPHPQTMTPPQPQTMTPPLPCFTDGGDALVLGQLLLASTPSDDHVNLSKRWVIIKL